MKRLLAVIGDGQAVPLLETALLVARRFNSRIVGLNAVTAEYAVVFGGEMGLTISSEVDRSVEHESEQKRSEARLLFQNFMARNEIPVGPRADAGPSAEWREESGRQNLVVGTLGRAFDLILLERPAGAHGAARAAQIAGRAHPRRVERLKRDRARGGFRDAVSRTGETGRCRLGRRRYRVGAVGRRGGPDARGTRHPGARAPRSGGGPRRRRHLYR